MQAFLYRSGNRPGEQAGFDEPVLINATTFNLPSFSLADFGVYIERAYVLEHTKGIYHFQVLGTLVKDVQYISMKDLQLSSAYGLSVAREGAFIQFVVAAQNRVIQYRLDSTSKNVLKIAEYTLPKLVQPSPLIQSNSRHIVCRFDSALTVVFTVGQHLPQQAKYIFKDVQQFQLFSSDYVWVYTNTSFTSYILQEPSLKIIGTSKKDPIYDVDI